MSQPKFHTPKDADGNKTNKIIYIGLIHCFAYLCRLHLKNEITQLVRLNLFLFKHEGFPMFALNISYNTCGYVARLIWGIIAIRYIYTCAGLHCLTVRNILIQP